jgi:hypothetical protein
VRLEPEKFLLEATVSVLAWFTRDKVEALSDLASFPLSSAAHGAALVNGKIKKSEINRVEKR